MVIGETRPFPGNSGSEFFRSPEAIGPRGSRLAWRLPWPGRLYLCPDLALHLPRKPGGLGACPSFRGKRRGLVKTAETWGGVRASSHQEWKRRGRLKTIWQQPPAHFHVWKEGIWVSLDTLLTRRKRKGLTTGACRASQEVKKKWRFPL